MIVRRSQTDLILGIVNENRTQINALAGGPRPPATV